MHAVSLLQAILLFLASSAGLVWAGHLLATYSDQIAERMKFSRLFVGTLLLAFATSLPELITTVSAARAGAPDLAVGNVFGSSMANMAILATIDLLYRGRVWPSVELGHARVAAVAIALTAMAGVSMHTQATLSIGWVGLTPIAIAGIYVFSIAWFRRMPLLRRPGLEEPHLEIQKPIGWSNKRGHLSLGAVWIRFGLSVLLILLTAPIVTLSVKSIAVTTGIAETFLGAALLAVTTSLPELIASLAAIRIGAYDMAVGNLFGSNVANMSVLVFADLAYTEGPILAAVSHSQMMPVLGAILLMGIAVAAIVGESEQTRIRRLEPDAIVLLLSYFATLTAIAMYG